MWPTWYITLVCTECGDTFDVGRPGGQDVSYVRTVAKLRSWFRNDQGEDVCHRHALVGAESLER